MQCTWAVHEVYVHLRVDQEAVKYSILRLPGLDRHVHTFTSLWGARVGLCWPMIADAVENIKYVDIFEKRTGAQPPSPNDYF